MEENNFHKIDEERLEAPSKIRQEVRGSLEAGRFTGKIIDLYLSKIGAVLSSFLRAFGSDANSKRK